MALIVEATPKTKIMYNLLAEVIVKTQTVGDAMPLPVDVDFK